MCLGQLSSLLHSQSFLQISSCILIDRLSKILDKFLENFCRRQSYENYGLLTWYLFKSFPCYTFPYYTHAKKCFKFHRITEDDELERIHKDRVQLLAQHKTIPQNHTMYVRALKNSSWTVTSLVLCPLPWGTCSTAQPFSGWRTFS